MLTSRRTVWLLLALLALGFVTSRLLDNHARTVDVLRNSHWQLAGVTSTRNGLQVRYSGESIVQQNGDVGQDNPPVNLYGTTLNVRGDFSLRAVVSELRGRAVLNLYGTPPLIEDEWRAEAGTASIRLDGGRSSLAVLNQIENQPASLTAAATASSSRYILEVSDAAGQLSLRINGRAVGQPLPDKAIFQHHVVWFGFEAPDSESSFTIASLTASGRVHLTDTRQQQLHGTPAGFAQSAQRKRPDMQIGAAISLGPTIGDARYAQLLGNYNAITPENAGKFQAVHPLPGTSASSYSFGELDALVDLARRAGMTVHGHALVFGEANPAWVQTLARQHPDQLAGVMTQHIQTVVGRYKGRIDGWDVIDEPLADYGMPPGSFGLRQNLWYTAIGPEYIVMALKAAHQADPRASLWINEFGLETDDARFGLMIDLIHWLQQQGAPLTGIGFEAHIDEGDTIQGDTHLDLDVLRRRIKLLADLGLKVRFSELDVSSASEYPVFGDVYKVCITEPACTGVTTWGITNKYSSAASLADGTFTTGIGLPWDANEQPLSPVSDIHHVLAN